jgi:hypothetical protein
MTDFFSELEGHLHDAAQRRARRRWVPETRVVFAVAAAAATLALVFAGLSAIDRGRDPEVAAPAPATESCDRAPAEVIRRFEQALATPAMEYEKVPASVVERLGGELVGGRPAPRIFPDAGKLALRDHDRDFWLVPARFGDRCTGAPGLCWNVVTEDANLYDCKPLNELDVPVEMVRDEGPEPWIAALVPEGVEVTVDGTRDGGKLQQANNVLLADVEPGADPSVGCNPRPIVYPPDRLRRRFAILRSSDTKVAGYFVTLVRLGCDPADAEPGLCVTGRGGRRCAAVTEEPFLLSLSSRQGDQVEVAAVVSDDPGAVVIGGNRITSTSSLTVTQVPGRDPDAVEVRLP